MGDNKRPHVLVVPFPAQGHVKPHMKLSQRLLSDHGMKVTFVNTHSNHAKMAVSMAEKEDGDDLSRIKLISVPDELGFPDESKYGVVIDYLTGLIEKINKNNGSDGGGGCCCCSHDEPITCILVDSLLWWILPVAEKMGLKQAVFWCAGPGSLALIHHIPMLIQAGVIDGNGTTMKDEVIKLSKDTPVWNSSDFTWRCPQNPIAQSYCFQMLKSSIETTANAHWLLCNTFYELDPSTCDMIPNILPVGPLPAGNDQPQAGSLWLEDSSCLKWLDNQPSGSVIYVAFGSTGELSQDQFQELALGLELSGQPFLWVVRRNTSQNIKSSPPEYPEGFLERVSDHGKIVSWAPQEQVLAHPSVACFLSHCGWNSTMEGLSSGVPFLCWPYFVDQFQNRSYICDVWKVGLRLNHDEKGIVSRREVERKIVDLISDENRIRTNALKLKEMARKSVSKGGSSDKNFENFILHLKQ